MEGEAGILAHWVNYPYQKPQRRVQPNQPCNITALKPTGRLGVGVEKKLAQTNVLLLASQHHLCRGEGPSPSSEAAHRCHSPQARRAATNSRACLQRITCAGTCGERAPPGKVIAPDRRTVAAAATLKGATTQLGAGAAKNFQTAPVLLG